MVPVQRAGRAHAGKVAAGARFGPGLRPDMVARQHGRQKAFLLLFGGEFHHGCAEQAYAVLVEPGGSTGAVVFFLENQPVNEIETAPAQFLRPGDHAPAPLVQLALPVAVRLETLARKIVRGKGRLRHVRFHPAAHFLPERTLLRRVFEIHASPAAFLFAAAADFASTPAIELPMVRSFWAWAKWCMWNTAVIALDLPRNSST